MVEHTAEKRPYSQEVTPFELFTEDTLAKVLASLDGQVTPAFVYFEDYILH